MIFTNTSPLRNVFKLVSLSSYAIKIGFLSVAKTAQFEFSVRVRVWTSVDLFTATGMQMFRRILRPVAASRLILVYHMGL